MEIMYLYEQKTGFADVHIIHQQNPVHLNSLDRAGQKSIELQRPQKGAVLYSSVQLSANSGQLCGGLSDPVQNDLKWKHG